MKKRSFIVIGLLTIAIALDPNGFAGASQTQAQSTKKFGEVKVRYNKSAKDRVLVDKDADLILDSAAQKLIIRSSDKPLDVPYGNVVRVLFEVTTHMRGGALGQLVGGIGGAAISAKKVSDYWCYVEYKTPGGSIESRMVEVGKDISEDVIESMQQAFGERVVVTEWPEKAAEIEKKTLADLQSKHDLKVDKKNHPLPEVKPDKALVVVVCPPLAARYSGKGNQFKVHANDQVILVNKMGTYSFAYLDPGEYMLASQSENANGFRMVLESGKEYYFLQNTFMGMLKAKTSLSRNSKELVMHELSGSHYADWKRKK